MRDVEDFKSRLGSYKICAVGSAPGDIRSCSQSIWPLPSAFMKSLNLKEIVWKDLEEKVLPAFRTPVMKLQKLAVSDKDLQKVFALMTGAASPFVLVLEDGRKLGLNTRDNVDLSITSADVASIIGAIWVFGAKAVLI